MALETLKDVTAINGVKVHRISWKSSGERFIEINDEDNAITFKVQNGPIKGNGINGCQVDDIVATTRAIIAALNEEFPCRENDMVIVKLDEALMWLEQRKKNRVTRGVEGFNKK